ncbi:hypothetical protein C7M84_015164 [Penaeus vannamei]|uniref:Uncharacterized protein n=1 Tax=Penaeus vannamei TaxID=6689 RepID=A0A3R7PHM3_PENVA|nr:hypothetical protein C7M84_015164 [Penaeus vannamei]
MGGLGARRPRGRDAFCRTDKYRGKRNKQIVSRCHMSTAEREEIDGERKKWSLPGPVSTGNPSSAQYPRGIHPPPSIHGESLLREIKMISTHIAARKEDGRRYESRGRRDHAPLVLITARGGDATRPDLNPNELDIELALYVTRRISNSPYIQLTPHPTHTTSKLPHIQPALYPIHTTPTAQYPNSLDTHLQSPKTRTEIMTDRRKPGTHDPTGDTHPHTPLAPSPPTPARPPWHPFLPLPARTTMAPFPPTPAPPPWTLPSHSGPTTMAPFPPTPADHHGTLPSHSGPTTMGTLPSHSGPTTMALLPPTPARPPWTLPSTPPDHHGNTPGPGYRPTHHGTFPPTPATTIFPLLRQDGGIIRLPFTPLVAKPNEQSGPGRQPFRTITNEMGNEVRVMSLPAPSRIMIFIGGWRSSSRVADPRPSTSKPEGNVAAPQVVPEPGVPLTLGLGSRRTKI